MEWFSKVIVVIVWDDENIQEPAYILGVSIKI